MKRQGPRTGQISGVVVQSLWTFSVKSDACMGSFVMYCDR